MPVNDGLLAILACPECKGPVSRDQAGRGLVCSACRVVYPVREGIPVMLRDEAVPLEEDSPQV